MERMKPLNVSTLAEVNYDTTLGDNMIGFDGHGTSACNKRVHGGDLRLKSWLGFRNNIAVIMHEKGLRNVTTQRDTTCGRKAQFAYEKPTQCSYRKKGM